MKLLFDQNLSPRLVSRLADLYPDATHVETVGLDQAFDIEVWAYARDNQFMIVTKDADFDALSLLWGMPPKVLWLRKGNCTVAQIESLLRHHYEAIRAFVDDEIASVLAIL